MRENSVYPTKLILKPDYREFAAYGKDSSLNNITLEEHIDLLSSNWIVRYDINAIRDQREIASIEVELPSQQVAVVLRRTARSFDSKRFEFPVSFSNDIQQVTILNFLMRIERGPSASEHSSHGFSVQVIDLPASQGLCPHDNHYRDDLNPACSCLYDWYRIVFSPSGRYLAILKGLFKPGDFTGRELTVYADEDPDSKMPNFKILAEIKTSVGVNVKKGFFAFHPYQPVLVIARLTVTSLWFFAESGTCDHS